MSIYYLLDNELQANKNKCGENYWFCYITELLSRLGVSGEPLSKDQLVLHKFTDKDFLFIGADALDKEVLSSVTAGLNNGLTLFGFGTKAADSAFGIKYIDQIEQPNDDFTLNGYFSIKADKQKTYLPVKETDFVLPIFSPVEKIDASGAEVIGTALINNETIPAFVRNNNSYYFTFDLTKILWVGSQGKPVYEGTSSFPVSRAPDSRVVPLDYNTKIAFSDFYLYIIQTVLAKKCVPMLHRLPPLENGDIPDLMLYYGGDDDATSAELNMDSSEIMYKKGLPYHINLMPISEAGDFQLTKEQFDIIKARGHELALHYDMAQWATFSEENFISQHQMYLNAYGEIPVSNVAHCFVHKGWAENARYQAKMGVKGDGRFGEVDINDINAFNMYGFAFGTSYPYFIYDDSEHQNVRIDFTDLPVSYYEPRIGGSYTNGLEQMHNCMDSSAYYGRAINLFSHPHYVAAWNNYDSSLVLNAFDEADRYCAANGYKVYHCGPDKLCLWWHDRAASSINEVSNKDNKINFSVSVAGENGMIVKVPFDGTKYTSAKAILNGQEIKCCIKAVDGLKWVMIPLTEAGTYNLSVQMQ